MIVIIGRREENRRAVIGIVIIVAGRVGRIDPGGHRKISRKRVGKGRIREIERAEAKPGIPEEKPGILPDCSIGGKGVIIRPAAGGAVVAVVVAGGVSIGIVGVLEIVAGNQKRIIVVFREADGEIKTVLIAIDELGLERGRGNPASRSRS